MNMGFDIDEVFQLCGCNCCTDNLNYVHYKAICKKTESFMAIIIGHDSSEEYSAPIYKGHPLSYYSKVSLRLYKETLARYDYNQFLTDNSIYRFDSKQYNFVSGGNIFSELEQYKEEQTSPRYIRVPISLAIDVFNRLNSGYNIKYCENCECKLFTEDKLCWTCSKGL